jgi:uroporphyrinogen III methyltransferase/synthase
VVAYRSDMARPGTVYLVGAGPGDPGLLTVRGAECLAAADVVLYDYLVNPALLERAPRADLIPVGKHGDAQAPTQDAVNALLVARARAGQVVVRLKGGDPFVFGRGGEEASALEDAGVPWEVVPGVTAAVAVPAYAGIPLTHRELAATVAFATGHERWDKEYTGIDWEALAKRTGTVVLFMSVRRLEANIAKLVEHGRAYDTPAALIEWGTLPRQRVVAGTLEDLAARAHAAGIVPPAMLVVGEVVRLRERLAWFERRPLSGLRVLTLRARAQSHELGSALADVGAVPVCVPVIRLLPPSSWQPLDAALAGLATYDYVIFTSQNAVAHVWDRLTLAGRDARAFGAARVCAIGAETAAQLATHGIAPDVVPTQAVAEGLASALAGVDVAGRRFLLPRAATAREVLPEALRARGAVVDIVTAYRTEPTPAAEVQPFVAAALAEPLGAALFASPSQVDAWFVLAPPAALAGVTAIAIGPATAAALARHHVADIHVAPEHNTGAMVELLVTLCARPASR